MRGTSFTLFSSEPEWLLMLLLVVSRICMNFYMMPILEAGPSRVPSLLTSALIIVSLLGSLLSFILRIEWIWAAAWIAGGSCCTVAEGVIPYWVSWVCVIVPMDPYWCTQSSDIAPQKSAGVRRLINYWLSPQVIAYVLSYCSFEEIWCC